jgi:hypothetical protein
MLLQMAGLPPQKLEITNDDFINNFQLDLQTYEERELS